MSQDKSQGQGRGQDPDKTTGQERAAEVRQNDPQKDESDSPPMATQLPSPGDNVEDAPVTEPPDEEGNPPKPVDDPDLPEEGDPEEFDEEEVPDDDFDEVDEAEEEREEPNDLSDVEKEFDDDAD